MVTTEFGDVVYPLWRRNELRQSGIPAESILA